jgi:hypothetical protein
MKPELFIPVQGVFMPAEQYVLISEESIIFGIFP